MISNRTFIEIKLTTRCVHSVYVRDLRGLQSPPMPCQVPPQYRHRNIFLFFLTHSSNGLPAAG